MTEDQIKIEELKRILKKTYTLLWECGIVAHKVETFMKAIDDELDEKVNNYRSQPKH